MPSLSLEYGAFAVALLICCNTEIQGEDYMEIHSDMDRQSVEER